jgi:hypothetical protein
MTHRHSVPTHSARRFPLHRVYIYLLVAALIATISRYIAYAALQFYSGLRGVQVQNRREIADEVSLVVGCLALIGVFALLASQA